MVAALFFALQICRREIRRSSRRCIWPIDCKSNRRPLFDSLMEDLQKKPPEVCPAA